MKRPSSLPSDTPHDVVVPPIGVAGAFALTAAVTIPMGLAVFVAVPNIIAAQDWQDGIVYWCAIIAAMAWQFVLATALLLRERRDWTWARMKERLWLTPPRAPGERVGRMSRLWWLVPTVFVGAFAIETIFGFLDTPFAALLPVWMDPPYNDITALATPENVGSYWLIWLGLLSCLFNYFLGEYLFFHGYLLPRMVVGMGSTRGGWLNALVFGLYHVHVAFRMPTVILTNIAYTLPSAHYRSTWPVLIIHALEGVVLMVMVTLAVMGKISA